MRETRHFSLPTSYCPARGDDAEPVGLHSLGSHVVDARRLATTTVNRGELFAQHAALRGHKFSFGDSNTTEDIAELDLEALELDDGKPFDVRFMADHVDILDVLCSETTIAAPYEHRILAWLKFVYRRSRGFELGTFDSSLLAITMKEQAVKWRDLALGYVSDVIAMVHSFVVDLMQYITPSDLVCRGLLALLMEDLRGKYEAALRHTEFLLSVELEGTPATLNHYFNDNLARWYVFSLIRWAVC